MNYYAITNKNNIYARPSLFPKSYVTLQRLSGASYDRKFKVFEDNYKKVAKKKVVRRKKSNTIAATTATSATTIAAATAATTIATSTTTSTTITATHELRLNRVQRARYEVHQQYLNNTPQLSRIEKFKYIPGEVNEKGLFSKNVLDFKPEVTYPINTQQIYYVSCHVQFQKFLFVAQSILTDRSYAINADNKCATNIHLGSADEYSIRNHFRDQYNYSGTSIYSREVPYLKNNKPQVSMVECYRFNKLDNFCPSFFDDQKWASIDYLSTSTMYY
ncbi:hypothetical protein ACTFIR_004396 [Dictyostelium discoideum]